MISKIHSRRPITTAIILAIIAVLTTVFTATATQSLEASTKQDPAQVAQSARGLNQSPPAQTIATLVSNAGQGDPRQTTFTRDHGQSFTTGYFLTGYTLDTVQIVSEDAQADDIALKVCTVDADGKPTSTCNNLTPPTAFAAGPLTFTAPTSPAVTLSTHTEYMIVFSSPGSEEVVVQATGSSDEDEDSLEHWSIADSFQWNNNGTNWTSQDFERSITITVRGTANDQSPTAPTSADRQVTLSEDNVYTFRRRDFPFNARTSGDRLASVTILSLPHSGSVNLGDTPVAAGQSVTIAQINAGSLTYTPAADAFGTPHTDFLFRVTGGTESSDHGNRMTVNVSPVQDPATGAPSITTAAGAHVGALMRANAADVADVDGPSSPDIEFQWVRGNGNNPTDITDATGANYHVQTQDAGQAIRVRAIFTDDLGHRESRLSPPTGPVGDPLANFIAAFAGTDSNIALGRVTNTNNMTVAAQSFTTGSSAASYTLERVSSTIAGTGSHDPRAYLYTDTSGSPGDHVATLSRSGSVRDAVNQFSAPSRTSLNASTTYWIVFHNRASNSSTNYDLQLTDQSSHDSGGSPGWTLGDQHQTATVARTRSNLTEAGSYTWTDGATGTAVKLSITASTALTNQPSFPDNNSDGQADSALFYVRENSRYNTLLGAVTADDSDNDRLYYSLAGTAQQQDQFAETFTLNASNGQIRVGRTPSVDHEARSAYQFQVAVTDREDEHGDTEPLTTVDDTVNVTIRVTNLDEPGVVSFSITQPGIAPDPEDPTQPEVEDIIRASLTDPDGRPANVTWQWSRSTSRGGRRLDVPDAATNQYTVKLEDHNYYLTATARYDDNFAKGRVAQAQTPRVRPQSQPRDPVFHEMEYSFSIAENARSGTTVGQVTTYDHNVENVTYTLRGPGSTHFSISASSGRITASRPLDHESQPAHRFTVDARDGSNLVTSQEVTVEVTNVDERERLTVSDSNPRMLVETVAHLSEGDHVSAKTWQWAAADNRSGPYTDIPHATSAGITPTPGHLDSWVNKYLRVTVTYTDPFGAGKTLEVRTNRITDSQPLLFSNVRRTANGQTQITNGNHIAQRFRTGSAGYTVNGAGLSVHSFVAGRPSGIQMTVHAPSESDPTTPGEAVFDLPVYLSDTGLNTAAPFDDLNFRTLERNATYFLVIGVANNGAVNLNTTTSTERDSGTASGWSITNQPLQSADQGDTWTASNSGNAMFIMYGEPGRTPHIVDQAMISRPLQHTGVSSSDSPYRLGERIEVQFTFDQPVRVQGNLSADIMIGTQAKKARHINVGNSRQMIFAYDVQPGDCGQFTLPGVHPIGNNSGSAVRAASGNNPARLDLPHPLRIAGWLSNVNGTAVENCTGDEVDPAATGEPTCSYVYCAKVNLHLSTDASEPSERFEYRLNEDGSTNGALTRHTFEFDNSQRRVESITVATVGGTETLRIKMSSISSRMRRQLSLLDGETHRPLSQANISNNVITWTTTPGQQPLTSQSDGINFVEVVEHQPHGRPTISGTLEPGYRLSARTHGITDENGVNHASFTYQWQRNGSAITGATGATHTLTANDAGRTIRVRASFEDILGNAYTLTSDSTERVAETSNTRTGFTKTSFTIEAPENTYTYVSFGIPVEWKQQENVDYPTFSLTGTDAESFDFYQASREDRNGLTETLELYSNVELDYETRRQYRMQVVATKDDNSTHTAAVTINVKNEDDPGRITLGGVHDPPRVEKTVSATVDDPDGARNVSWHWQRGTPTGHGWTDIPGATRSSYRLTETDFDYSVRVMAIYTDRLGNDATLFKDLDAIYPSEIGWIDGNLNILKNGRPITLEYNSSNEVSTGDRLTGNTSRLAHTYPVVTPYYYRWIIIGTNGEPEHTYIGTESTDALFAGFGNGRTFTVPHDTESHRTIRATVAWREQNGPTRHSTYAFVLVLPEPAASGQGTSDASEPVDSTAPQLRSATADGPSLTLAYSEELDNSNPLSSSLFAVNVNGAFRPVLGVAVGQDNVILLLSPAVAAEDTVTVDYTVPTDEGTPRLQDASGNAAESLSGQAVTNNTASSGNSDGDGTSDQQDPPGAPADLYVTRQQSGSLKAAWEAPGSGSAPTGYTIQWKESGDTWEDPGAMSKTGVTRTSYVITGLTDGVEYTTRVIATKDGADGAPSQEVNAIPRETTPPAVASAAADGAELTITFNEALDTDMTPHTSAFAVTVAGDVRGVQAVTVSGSAVTLTLVTAVSADDAVTVGYTAPADESESRLRDEAGNDAAFFTGQSVSNDTPAAVQLTATAHDVPANHDGNATFSFELRFSETPEDDFSYKTLRDHAFSVTGGEVVKANRLVPGENVRWQVHVTPDGSGSVTVTLPPTTDCEAEEAICTEDGRKLSGKLDVTVPKQNSPATGAPTITGTAQVGETLTADVSGIADADGLTNVSFAYQWLANDGSTDTDIQGATGSTYTLDAEDEGQTIRVRVSFTDDAGNEETLTSAATAAVGARPNRPATGRPAIGDTAEVGETLTADISGIADADGLESATFAYQWIANDGTIDVDISGATESTYTLKDTDEGKTIRVGVSFTDDAGNEETLTSTATAAVADAPSEPLTASLENTPESHDGQSGFTFDLRFSEEFSLSYKILRDHAFTVTGGAVKTAQRLDKPSNVLWRITVEPDSSADVTVVLPVTTDCGDQGAICTGDGRILSNRLELTVNGPGG